MDFRTLRPGQLCNHFPNNQELTTKVGLARNLLRLSGCEHKCEWWFPRCYDFTDQTQIEWFSADYEKTAVVNYVRRHGDYFKSVHWREIKQIKREVERGGEWKKRAKVKCKGVYLMGEGGCKNIVNVKMLKLGIEFLKYQIKLRTGVLDESTDDKWKHTEALETLLKLSQHKGPPYDIPTLKQILNIVGEGWEIPSLHFECKLVATLKKYSKACPQSKIDGTGNIWIVKPSFTSRGIGVHCINSPKDEVSPGKKVQAKVVQKYIERPFLLLLKGPKGDVEKRKFDLRQWVLVTSISPLVVYMFSSCYLKICGSEFSLGEFKDKYRHIANFSIQKTNQRVNNINTDLTMSVPQFIEHLRECHGIKLNWESDMIPKLAKIVKATIYSGSDVIEHRENCFELYGFDFVLDYKLNPWLIEVNLSPACCRRTEWLGDMLSKCT